MTAAQPVTRSRTRQRGLAAAAALTLAATAWVALQPPEPPEPAVAEAVRPSRPAPEPVTTLAKPQSPRWPDGPASHPREAWPRATARAVAAWEPPAPPPPPPAPRESKAADRPPAPTAPPFPYKLFGRIDDGQPRALLSGPVRSFGVQAADVIDGQWRVDAVQEQGLALTWLPGGTKQTIRFTPS